MLISNTWNHLTVSKQMSSRLFKNKTTYELFTQKSYVIYVQTGFGIR